MKLSHALHHSLAGSVFALTVFFAPHLFAGADEMIALWREAPPVADEHPLWHEDAVVSGGLIAFGDLEPAPELDAATQAALDDALRYSETASRE